MKAFLTGVIAAVALATLAAFVLNTEFQHSVVQFYQTDAVRL